jgi:hypothetical protein
MFSSHFVGFYLLTDNLVEDLLGDFEYQLQAPYIMYRNAAQEVIGIWFYNSQECQEVANLFNRYQLQTCKFYCCFFFRALLLVMNCISKGNFMKLLRFFIFLLWSLFIECCVCGVNTKIYN